MSMSFGGNEGLFKLAENAAPDENRLMPSERKYPQSTSMVSVEEAVALMKQRKKNPELRIKGGLDDTSDAVKKGRPRGANKLVGEIAESNDAAKPIEPVGITDDGMEDLGAKRRKRRGSDDILAKVMASLDSRMAAMQKSLSATSAPERSAAREDKLATFKSGSHKVVFKLNGMELTVKCLHMVKDTEAHTLVFVFDDSGDSFFTPPKNSELQVKYDGIDEPGVLFYFGMVFTVKALGLKFLGFLYDDGPRGQADSE